MKHFSCTRLVVVALASLGFAPLAWPGINSCTSGTTLDNYLPTSIDSGCAYLDNSFSNFVVNSQPQSTLGTPGTITLTSNPTVGDTLTSTSGLGVAEFTSPAWALNNSTVGTENQTDLQYVVQANTGGTLGGYTYTNGTNGYVSPALSPWAISSITLDVSNVTTVGPETAEANIVVTEVFCLSSTAGAALTCPAADEGRLETILQSNGTGGVFAITFECVAPGSTLSNCNQSAFTVNADGTIITYTLPGAGVQAVSIYENLDLTAEDGTSLTLNGLFNDYGEESTVPETSSFLLVGLGAIGLALLGHRRSETLA